MFKTKQTKIKVYACYTVKIYKKQTRNFFQRGGGTPGALILDPPSVAFDCLSDLTEFEQSLHTVL